MAHNLDPGKNLIPVRAAEDEYLLSLGDMLQVIRKRGFLIALVTCCLIGGVLGYTLIQTPRYEASVIMLVGQPAAEVDPASIDDKAAGLDQLSVTLTDLVDTRNIAVAVIRQLRLPISVDDFRNNLSAEHTSGTQLIYLRYRDTSPERAQRVANTVADVFSERVSEVNPGGSGVSLKVWQKAVAPTEPVSPNLKLNIALALLMGVTLGVVLAFLVESLDNSRRALKEQSYTRQKN
jgi:capsular polysaccharide biosynthesis protein